MLKVNELKTLRKQNLEEENEDSIQIHNPQNVSSRSRYSDKQTKPIKRIEIDAGEDNEDSGNLLKDVEQDISLNKNINKQQSTDKSNKIFMTENGQKFEAKEIFSFHDLIIPGGKNAKLCLVTDPFAKTLRVTEIADHFKFHEPTPVIVLIGANTNRIGKLLAGLSRAALNTRAVILDSGLSTGIEKFCLRKNLTLIGIAPENAIEYPKLTNAALSNKMLTNGHTHFILLGNEKNKYLWGEETKFKINFAERLSNGRKGFPYKSKVVGVIVGNIPKCEEEINVFVDKNWPLILVEDSEVSHMIKSVRNNLDVDVNDLKRYNKDFVNKISTYAKLIEIEEDSEVLASAVHLCLTITI